MKKGLGRKLVTRLRKANHRALNARPMEFGRSWQDLEAQHERLQMDWSSLAAQLGVGG